MKPIRKILISTMLVAPTFAFAQEISQCHAFADDPFARLSCYDETSGFGAGDHNLSVDESENEGASEQEGLAASNWVYVEDEDALRGTNTNRVVLEVSQYEGRDAPQNLVIRCTGAGDSEILISGDGYIGGDRVLVIYKWNDDVIISERWSGGTTGTAAFLPNGYKDFLRGLPTGGRLVF